MKPANAQPMPGYASSRFGALELPAEMALLHGFTGGGTDWRFWPGDGPSAVAPDLPGHGGSPNPGGDFEAETTRLLAALPNEVDHLVGYSLGGRIALSISARIFAGIRLLDDAALGDDAVHQRRRGHVEHRVVGIDASGPTRLPPQASTSSAARSSIGMSAPLATSCRWSRSAPRP
jgi:pimeloyl-ACP methyl ester carboxylesterase